MVVETESVGGEHRPHYYPIPVYLSFGFGVWARGRVDLSGAIEINPLIDSRSPGESPGARVVHKSPGMLTHIGGVFFGAFRNPSAFISSVGVKSIHHKNCFSVSLAHVGNQL